MSKIMKLIGIKSRKASERKVDINTKNKVLNFYAKLLDKEKKLILRENLKDVKFAKNKGIIIISKFLFCGFVIILSPNLETQYV